MEPHDLFPSCPLLSGAFLDPYYAPFRHSLSPAAATQSSLQESRVQASPMEDSGEKSCSCWATTLVFVAALLCNVLLRVVRCLWWKPWLLRRAMEKQGVKGPPPLFMIGNYLEIEKLEKQEMSADMSCLRHDILQRMLPHYTKWSKIYGKRFVFWEGSEPRLVVTEPELIREVFSAKYALTFGKSLIHQRCTEHFLGKGVVMANGHNWARQRRIIAPAFHLEKLKGLAAAMTSCTEQMLCDWEELVRDGNGQAELDASEHLRRLTADIIACTEFGSSYEKGKRIFERLTSLQQLTLQFAHFVWLPGSRFLPTSWNLQIWRLKREMEKSLREIIQERRDLMNVGRFESYCKDLLGLMLAESDGNPGGDDEKQPRFTTQQLMDECKTFFFAGHETTAGLLTWTMLLLASNSSWQERARMEVVDVCQGNLPDAESLYKFKVLGMILNEALRLYPPAIVITRYALEEMKLGEMAIPKGAAVWIPILAIHLDRELWGEDAAEFRPERFEHGVAEACKKHPLAYMPFAFGPRNCVGQSFALMEAKLVLAAILLRNFRFSLSPRYRHAPAAILTLKPQHGAPILLQRP